MTVFQVGDRVCLTYEGEIVSNGNMRVETASGGALHFGASRIRAAVSAELLERPPPQVKVGDFVRVTDGWHHSLTVGVLAQVLAVNSGDPNVFQLDGYSVRFGSATSQWVKRSQFELA